MSRTSRRGFLGALMAAPAVALAWFGLQRRREPNEMRLAPDPESHRYLVTYHWRDEKTGELVQMAPASQAELDRWNRRWRVRLIPERPR